MNDIEKARKKWAGYLDTLAIHFEEYAKILASQDVEFDFRPREDVVVREGERALLFYENGYYDMAYPGEHVIDKALLSRKAIELVAYVVYESEKLYVSLLSFTEQQWTQTREHRIGYHAQYLPQVKSEPLPYIHGKPVIMNYVPTSTLKSGDIIIVPNIDMFVIEYGTLHADSVHLWEVIDVEDTMLQLKQASHVFQPYYSYIARNDQTWCIRTLLDMKTIKNGYVPKEQIFQLEIRYDTKEDTV